jgi:methylisocitrate lyase
MLETSATPAERRRVLSAGLSSGRLLRFPGAFNALCALLIAQYGFEGIYVSGAATSAALGLPDVGLTSVSEVSAVTAEIARASALPVLVDADTGFGEPLNVARAVQLLEDSGAAGCHLEDQVMPKRCGHLEGKTLAAPEEMLRRLAAARVARRDPNFVLCARTDARALEGVPGAIERARAYAEAGADLIFVEALESPAEIAAVRAAIDAPLLVNVTEFGRTPLLRAEELAALGVNVVLYPVTLLRLAMGAVERGLGALRDVGTQSGMLDEMQSRSRLYEVIDYASYARVDDAVFNFRLPAPGGPDAH